jgi:hypothetical protein
MRGNELLYLSWIVIIVRELSISERELFYDDEHALCRDCWINKTFEPVRAGAR